MADQDVVVEQEQDLAVRLGDRLVVDRRVIEGTGTGEDPHPRVGGEAIEEAERRRFAAIVVGDDHLEGRIIGGHKQSAEAFAQDIGPVAGGNDHRHERSRAGDRPADLQPSGGSRKRSHSGTGLTGARQMLGDHLQSGVVVEFIGNAGISFPAGMVEHERQVADALGRRRRTGPQNEVIVAAAPKAGSNASDALDQAASHRLQIADHVVAEHHLRIPARFHDRLVPLAGVVDVVFVAEEDIGIGVGDDLSGHLIEGPLREEMAGIEEHRKLAAGER